MANKSKEQKSTARSASHKKTDQIIADMETVDAVPDVVAQRIADENAKKESAFLGYAKIDFVKLDPKFGDYNVRPVVPIEVTKMVKSMRGKMNRYSEEHLIPIVIPKSWIACTLAQTRGNGGDVYPTLTFTAEADLKNIRAAGGQHRLAAMKQISDEFEAQIAVRDTDIEKLQAKLDSGVENPAEIIEEKEKLLEERGALVKQMKGQRMWGLRVYDFDMAEANGQEIGLLLSKNDPYHRYNETEEEWFIEHINKMMNDPLAKESGNSNIDKLRSKYSALGREKGTAYGEIFGSPGGIHMLSNMWKYHKYYRQTKMFTKGYLKKKVLGQNMGIMSVLAVRQIQLMSHLASKTPFVDQREVKTTIGKALGGKTISKAEQDVWIAKAEALGKKYEEAGETDNDFWTVEMLEQIDTAAQEAFGEIKTSIATKEDAYVNMLAQYMRDLINIVDTHQRNHPLTESVLGRIRWAFTDHANRPNVNAPAIPLMTESVFVMLNEVLNSLHNGIEEITRWLEPLFGYPVSNAGHERWTDATDTIVRSVKSDRRFDDPDGAIDQLFNIILEHRRTFVYDLDMQLSTHGALLKREAKGTDLAPYFATKEPKKKSAKARDEFTKFDFLKKTKDRDAKISTIVKHMESKADNEPVPRSEHSPEWNLLMASCCPWKGIDKKTRKAKFREIAKILMVETERLSRYRPKLATKTSAARFRNLIEEEMSNYAVTTRKEGQSYKQWGLWDHRNVDLDNITMPKVLSLDEEQEVENEREALKEQTQDIHKIIKTIGSATVAKANQGRAGLAIQVHEILEDLVEVLSDNGDRLRFRAIHGDETEFFAGKGDLARTSFALPEPVSDDDEYVQTEGKSRNATVSPKKTQKGKGKRPARCEVPSDDEGGFSSDDNANVQPKKKARRTDADPRSSSKKGLRKRATTHKMQSDDEVDNTNHDEEYQRPKKKLRRTDAQPLEKKQKGKQKRVETPEEQSDEEVDKSNHDEEFERPKKKLRPMDAQPLSKTQKGKQKQVEILEEQSEEEFVDDDREAEVHDVEKALEIDGGKSSDEGEQTDEESDDGKKEMGMRPLNKGKASVKVGRANGLSTSSRTHPVHKGALSPADLDAPAPRHDLSASPPVPHTDLSAPFNHDAASSPPHRVDISASQHRGYLSSPVPVRDDSPPLTHPDYESSKSTIQLPDLPGFVNCDNPTASQDAQIDILLAGRTSPPNPSPSPHPADIQAGNVSPAVGNVSLPSQRLDPIEEMDDDMDHNIDNSGDTDPISHVPTSQPMHDLPRSRIQSPVLDELAVPSSSVDTRRRSPRSASGPSAADTKAKTVTSSSRAKSSAKSNNKKASEQTSRPGSKRRMVLPDL